jgi:hypothetical protein
VRAAATSIQESHMGNHLDVPGIIVHFVNFHCQEHGRAHLEFAWALQSHESCNLQSTRATSALAAVFLASRRRGQRYSVGSMKPRSPTGFPGLCSASLLRKNVLVT